MGDGPDKIDPSGIPVFTGNLDALHEAYTDLSGDARAIRRLGRVIDDKFKGLSAFYESPEAEDLFALTKPVRDDTGAFGRDLSQVQNALRMYRGTISGIVARLNVLRGEARSFLNSIADDQHWQSSQSNVDRNNELLQEVSRLVGRFWEAERTCANKITGLWGGTQWVADDGTGADHMYGVSVQEMEQAGETPWGKAIERNARGWEVFHHVKGFVWDGVIVDGVWGTLVGLGGMVGLQGWDTFKESWNGLGQLAFGANSYTNPLVRLIYEVTPDGAVKDWMDESQRAPVEAGKAFVAWDTWGDDPARAAGAASFNIVTALATGGAGAGVRGASLGARFASTTNRIGTALDPTTHLVNGARAITNIPKLGRVVDDLAATTARVNEFPDGTVRLPNGDILHPDGRLEAPSGATTQTPNQVPTEPPAHERAPQPVREPATVGAPNSPNTATAQLGDNHPAGTARDLDSTTPHTGGGLDTPPASPHDGPGGPSGGASDGPSIPGSRGPEGPPSGGEVPWGDRAPTPEEVGRYQADRANTDPVWFKEHYRENGYRRDSRYTEYGYEIPMLAKDQAGKWVSRSDLPPAIREQYLEGSSVSGERTKIPPEQLRELDASARARQDAIDADRVAEANLSAAERAYKTAPTDELRAAQELADQQHKPLHSNMTKSSEMFGENVAEYHAIPENYPNATRVDNRAFGNHRFDQIWKDQDGRYIVVEAKGSTKASLGERWVGDGVRARQGTKEYFESIVGEMRMRGRRAENPDLEELALARELDRALKEGNVDYVLVQAKGNDGQYVGYDMKHFKLRS